MDEKDEKSLYISLGDEAPSIFEAPETVTIQTEDQQAFEGEILR
jgi:hypothetical protein